MLGDVPVGQFMLAPEALEIKVQRILDKPPADAVEAELDPSNMENKSSGLGPILHHAASLGGLGRILAYDAGAG